MSRFDLPAELKGPTTARRTARVDSLGKRMTGPSETAPPAAPAADTPTRTTGTWQPPADVGPRSFHTPSEKTTKRKHVELNPGMKARLIGAIGRARAFFAEGHSCGVRRQQLIQDLMAARRAVQESEDYQARKSWLERQKGLDHHFLKELEQRRQGVEGLRVALELVTAQQNAAIKQGCALRSMIGRIARPLRMRQGQVVFGGYDEDNADLDVIEERLYEKN